MDMRLLGNLDLHALLCASLWTLSEWPSHFHETLEDILDSRATLKRTGVSKDSFLQGVARLFDNASYKWLWEEIKKFTGSTNHPQGRYWYRYMSRLSESKSNKSKNTPEPSRQIEFDNTQKLSLNEAARILDISGSELIRLTLAGIIDTVPKDRLGQRNKWIFSQTHLEALLRKIQGLAIHRDTGGGFLPILNAVKSLRSKGIAYTDLLQSLLDGDLQAYSLRGPKALSSIFVRKIDLDQYVGQLLGDEWSFDKTMIFLGVSAVSMVRFHQLGILFPSRRAQDKDHRVWKYIKTDVYDFQSKYITTAEAAKIIGCSERTVLYWAKQLWLPAVCGRSIDGSRTYLFDKEEIAQWRFERLKSDEAKQLLSIKQRTMEDWIAKGILHPLKDMSVHPYWFARQEIESLREGKTD